MGRILNSVLSGVVDRVAKQVSLIKIGFNNAIATGVPYYERIHVGVGGQGDYNVESDLISAANGIDTNTLSGTFLKSVYNSLCNDLDTHIQEAGAVSFDSFLNISGINVHPDFEDTWKRCKNVGLDSRNTFFSDENILMAYYNPTGSGTGVFAAGTTVGTGTGKTSPTNHAAAKAVLVPVLNVSSDTQFDIRTTREQPTDGSQIASHVIRVPNGTVSGTQFILPVAPGDLASGILSVTNIVAAGGSSGNGFRIYALREREIAL